MTRQAILFREKFNDLVEEARASPVISEVRLPAEVRIAERAPPPQVRKETIGAAEGAKPSKGQPISVFQSSSLATGRQPKWNANFQLIEDGLEDPFEHMRRALELDHPGQEEGSPN